MGMGGVYREIVAPERVVSTEKFDEPWYPGEAVGTLVFVEQAGRTTATQTMLYESRETRDAVLKSGMESGVATSYDRLAPLLMSVPAQGMEKGAKGHERNATSATDWAKYWRCAGGVCRGVYSLHRH
jgi:hypothetical protein